MAKLRYANISNPHVNALVTGRFRFEREEQAISKMEFFRENFTVARKLEEEHMPEGKECFVMWIHDYSVTQEERDNGVLGNYAFVTPEEMDSGIVTLACVKLSIDMKFHPKRKRQKQRLPNWGHPILRAVKKQKHYETLESITAELDHLHMEYPDTTIPGDNKLMLMIFDRAKDEKNPVQKYVIKIVPTKDEVGYTFEYKENEYKGRKGPNATVKQDNTNESPQGYFTSMVALKRNKRPTTTGGSGGTSDS